MSYALIKRLTAIVLPVALLAATFVVLHKVQLLSAAQRELAFLVPYVALCCGLALSLAFNRGRVFLTLIVTGLFYMVARSCVLPGGDPAVCRTLFLCSSVIIPLDLCLFCFMRERGIFTHSGRIRFLFLLAQLCVVFWITRFRQDYSAVAELIALPVINSALLQPFAMPQMALLLFVVSGTLIAIRTLKRRCPIDAALLGTLVALGIALNRLSAPYVPPVFITAAVLLLTVGVLQDSHSMAFSDELTGLPSRRALNEQVMGLGRRYVVAMLDVDHFKRFNDTFGHDVGDQVLKMVGAKIAGVKGGGKPFRYGGEEFTVIFPRKELKEVTPHLEELRQSIGSYQLSLRGADRPKEADLGKSRRSGGLAGGKTVSVTVSIGVAAAGDEIRTPAEVIRAADRALYRAKQRGRNQIAT